MEADGQPAPPPDELLGGLLDAVVEAARAGQPLLLDGQLTGPNELFSWSRLNHVLRAMELDWAHPDLEGGRWRFRLALAREGKPVDPALFFRKVESPRRQTAYRLDPACLLAQLESGGTFVVRELDRQDPAVMACAERLEERFRAPVMAGAFASWGSSTGFDLHWDEMDNLVVQLAGERRWELWPPAVPWPLAGMTLPRPQGPPSVAHVLRPGDALFFPRGWWHCPRGMCGPSLHLTFGIYRRTGLDLVRWLAARGHESHALISGHELSCDPCSREAVSREAVSREAVSREAVWPAELIDQFLADQQRVLVNRLSFTLPDLRVDPLPDLRADPLPDL